MMEPSTAALFVSLLSSSNFIAALVLIFLFIVVPFITKFWSWSKETSAQGVLYQQLSDMVQTQRKELDKLYEQRKEDQDSIFELKHKVEGLTNCEKTVDILKKKLDQKDQIIAERDSRITKLLEELMQMKDRVHNLEIKLKADEDNFCKGCTFKSQYIPSTLTGGIEDE